MINEFFKIINFIIEHIVRIWPYLLITIPLAVSIRMTGTSKYINKVFEKRSSVSIILATLVGAFSPFCSCSVIPIIASLLISGVPLAPVMSFWLASPSMDPEIFFLSVSTLGWNLAIWRLASTFMMSLLAGFITHYLIKKNFLKNEDTLKARFYNSRSNLTTIKEIIKEIYSYGKNLITKPLSFKGNMSNFNTKFEANNLLSNIGNNDCKCSDDSSEVRIIANYNSLEVTCCNKSEKDSNALSTKYESNCCGDLKNDCVTYFSGSSKKNLDIKKFLNKLGIEAYSATIMVLKFMVLAYLLEALIVLYVPSELIKLLLKENQFLSIINAALLGVPIYTNNMAALGLVGGLLIQGMSPAAALAFLVSGPTTTIPAMAAVWNLANKKVFFLYVSFTLAGSIISGLIYYLSYFIL